jgi:hypothetical protein
MMMRNIFVREESDRLIVGSGVFAEWLDELGPDADLHFGPTATPWGPVSVTITRDGEEALITIAGTWRRQAPRIDVFLPSWGAALDVSAGAPIRIARGARTEWHSGEEAEGMVARRERMSR